MSKFKYFFCRNVYTKYDIKQLSLIICLFQQDGSDGKGREENTAIQLEQHIKLHINVYHTNLKLK